MGSGRHASASTGSFPASLLRRNRARARARRSRARAHRGTALRVLLPHGVRRGEVREIAQHPLPGPRLRGELRGVLRLGHHRSRSFAHVDAVRALHLPRAQRAAGHRRGLRARAARGSHPVHLRQVRPRPRRARRHRHHLSSEERGARRRQGAGALARAGRPLGQEHDVVGRSRSKARTPDRDRLRSGQSGHRAPRRDRERARCASRVISRSMSAASSSRAARCRDWCRSRTPRCPTAR